MQYRMPSYHHRDGWVGIANQKRHVSLYTCGEHCIAAFTAKHPDINAGKGCLRFRDRDELPLADLKAVIRRAMEQEKG
jgi:uncharacterized protein YdhG (YjbR/CyaY superfamily)